MTPIQAPTLSGPTVANVLIAAVQWIEGVLLGSVATAIAVIAIGVMGMMMMSGRINLRRGATVIVGCFILFGAATIARGLREVAATARNDAIYIARNPPVMPAAAPVFPNYLAAAPTSASGVADDPYAGAAVRR